MKASSVEVLVVGAGPSGLFAALELARHGVKARVVEGEARPHHEARAATLQPASLEILAAAGVLDSVLASSVHLHCGRLFDADLRLVHELPFAGIGTQWEFQCSLPQWRTEQILTERFVELGGVVERGVAVTALEDREDGVLVSLELSDGTSETVEAEWVIGAGGAHSVTRESMEESLVGQTYPGTSLVGDIRVDCGLPRDGAAVIAGEGGYVMLAPLPQGRWITFVGHLEEHEVDRLADDASASTVETIVQRRVRAALRVEDVAWASTFRVHRRLVRQLAGRRRFLLGDAGHLSTPFAGEGLNSGLQDAQNLAWKLALVLHGRGRRALLDSFAFERLAADRHVLEVSDRMNELVDSLVDPARAQKQKQQPQSSPGDATEFARSRAMLDVSYAGSPIVGEYLSGLEGVPPAPSPGDRFPDRITLEGTRHHLLLFGKVDEAGLARVGRRWKTVVDVVRAMGEPERAGLRSEGAVLVRPDGFIGFRAVPADAEGLAAVDSHLESYLVPN